VVLLIAFISKPAKIEEYANWFGYISNFEVRKMRIEEIKEVVKGRYGKFAETGGHKEAC
jgi:hypothetical protein